MNHYISFRDYWDRPVEHSAVITCINEWILTSVDSKDYQWAYAKFMFREKHIDGAYPNPLGLSLQNECDLLAFKIKFGHIINGGIDY